jgi:hypothetical protein
MCHKEVLVGNLVSSSVGRFVHRSVGWSFVLSINLLVVWSVCRSVVWLSFDVDGFWNLWDNNYGYVCLLLYMFPSFLTGTLLVR